VAVMAYLFRVRAGLLESAELNVAGAIEAMGWERAFTEYHFNSTGFIASADSTVIVEPYQGFSTGGGERTEKYKKQKWRSRGDGVIAP
jgi:hypothetical protein